MVIGLHQVRADVPKAFNQSEVSAGLALDQFRPPLIEFANPALVHIVQPTAAQRANDNMADAEYNAEEAAGMHAHAESMEALLRGRRRG